MSDSCLKNIEPYAYYIQTPKNKTILDKFLDKELAMDIFVPWSANPSGLAANSDSSVPIPSGWHFMVPSGLLFVALCTINVPFAFFYTTLFFHFNSYKNTNYQLYYNFMIGSIIIFGYFVLLILSISVINIIGGVNLHPISSERPYFYFV